MWACVTYRIEGLAVVVLVVVEVYVRVLYENLDVWYAGLRSQVRSLHIYRVN